MRDISGPVSISLPACWVSFLPESVVMRRTILISDLVEEVALEREVEGDLFLQDIGQGFGFRPGSFDGAIRCNRRVLPKEKSKLKTNTASPSFNGF